jgi:hypothetical protein
MRVVQEPHLSKRTADRVRARVTAILSELPEARAVDCGAHLSLEVRKKRFGWLLADHHGDGRLAINCKVPALVAGHLASVVPAQFHLPKYVGSRGWIGLWLDVPHLDWLQVAMTLREAYCLSAPRALASQLAGAANGPRGQRARSVRRKPKKRSATL